MRESSGGESKTKGDKGEKQRCMYACLVQISFSVSLMFFVLMTVEHRWVEGSCDPDGKQVMRPLCTNSTPTHEFFFLKKTESVVFISCKGYLFFLKSNVFIFSPRSKTAVL